MNANDKRILTAICNGAKYKAVNVYCHKVREGRTKLYQAQQVIIEDKLVGEDCAVILTERDNGIVYEWWDIAEQPFRDNGDMLEVKEIVEDQLSNRVFDAMPDSIFHGDRWDMNFDLAKLRVFVQTDVFLPSVHIVNEEARARRMAGTEVDLTSLIKH